MRLLEAMQRMRDALAEADAPGRQLRRVRDWETDIGYAVAAARKVAWAPTIGLEIRSASELCLRGWARPEHIMFLYGRRTHKAWRILSEEIISALALQRACAATIVTAIPRVVPARQAVMHRARLQFATQWMNEAATAEAAGRFVVASEDAVMCPLGEAVSRAGGVQEVALVKHYHQIGERS